ncbi:MAG: hypothetical protein HC892_01585 [Saprospiraceae bacterium]|nr:hypothetical protein [Saprospiraceae bacterium]
MKTKVTKKALSEQAILKNIIKTTPMARLKLLTSMGVTKDELIRDYKKKAKPVGKRKSASGKTYKEYHVKRTDAKGSRI